MAARPTSVDTLEAIGLWGTNPEGDLDRARTLFASGDLAGSAGAAGAAQSAWTGAAAAGQARLVSIGILALALLLGLVILAFWLRGRGRRRADDPCGRADGRALPPRPPARTRAGTSTMTPRSPTRSPPCPPPRATSPGRTRTLHSPPLRTRSDRSRSETRVREERNRADGSDALAAVARDPVGRLG